MSIRRRSTVHDLASLRLHPDGSRVQTGVHGPARPSGSRSGRHGTRATAASTTTRLARYTARDARGNWIARDAGGRGAVKQRRRVTGGGEGKGRDLRAAADGDGEAVVGLDSAGAGGSSPPRQWESEAPGDRASDGGGSAGDGEDGVKDARAQKRMKFYHDFSFLDALHSGSPALLNPSGVGPSSSQAIAQSDTEYPQMTLPIPSSDLLKCIHHFASEYYSAIGCLYDAAREARRQRKARKLQKVQKRVDDDQDSDIEDVGNGDEEPKGDSDEGESSGEENESQRRGKKRKKGQKRSKDELPPQDMYKAFDGSALMVIGMLLQEHIVQMMSAKPSEKWEQQMLAHEAEEGVIQGGTRARKKTRVGERGKYGGRDAVQTVDTVGEDDGEERSTDGDDDGDESLADDS